MNAQRKDRVVLLDGARTPVGRFLGALKDVPAHELGGTATRAALSRADVAPNQIGEVVMGCIGQVGKDAFNARRVAFAADIPDEIPGYTVNRLCGSGLQAIWSAAMQLREGEIEFAVAGGDESMSRMPFYDFDARDGRKLGDRALHDGTMMMLTDPFHDIPMGVTAENVAAKYDVSREAQDQFAAESQRRAATAEAQAAFADEIVPVQTTGRTPSLVTLDEHPRPETTVESLAALRPSFDRSGTVTAGNSSGINDGAAAVVLAREEVARRRGHDQGLVALEAVATAAIKPELMGYAPVLALKRLFKQTGVAPSDVDVIELNEAFAAQAVAVIRGAGLPEDRTNPYGGAIALGHPVGATGAILTVRVMKDLIRRDCELGIVTMCIGGGQALAALLRRLN